MHVNMLMKIQFTLRYNINKKPSIFCVMTSCAPSKIISCFGGICRLLLQDWKVSPSKTSIRSRQLSVKHCTQFSLTLTLISTKMYSVFLSSWSKSIIYAEHTIEKEPPVKTVTNSLMEHVTIFLTRQTLELIYFQKEIIPPFERS
jgi:hypothetical protein